MIVGSCRLVIEFKTHNLKNLTILSKFRIFSSKMFVRSDPKLCKNYIYNNDFTLILLDINECLKDC